jgi:Kef-type K+ transport system membrane component KefB
MLDSFHSFTLPIADPVLKFLVILAIILAIPILSDRVKIPHLLGMILAGIVIGPNGLNLLARDSSIILSGTAGLLYIMFLAGLEIDLTEFKKNSAKSLLFGLFTFIVPMGLGTLSGIYILNFSLLTSILLASMFASHTLLAYPILSKLGVTKTRSVNIAVGGTMITDTLALLVLAVIVGMSSGEVNTMFWIRLSVSVLIFGAAVMLLFPIIGRWFLKRYEDKVSQYIFVLMMVFLGAVLAELAGIEAIIGAFLAGLALNRLIPSTSPLMNRVEFVGNAIFIPFFLIGVGMLVDFRAFFEGYETIKVAMVMTIIATLAKFIAAWLTQKSLRFSIDERRIIFGLSNAQAAATLAAVLVGYNVVIGQTEGGEPIRLLNESILNGSIIMILITCTIATFSAQRGGKNLALLESTLSNDIETASSERILIPISNPNTVEELINLSRVIKSKANKQGIYALSVINSESEEFNAESKGRKLLEKAKISASSTDLILNTLLRYDLNIVNGVSNIIKEKRITDLIIGLHVKSENSDSFLGSFTEGVLAKCNITTFIYRPYQPISTIKRHVVVIPDKAEHEPGFSFWLAKVWNIGVNSGAKIIFFSTEKIISMLKEITLKHPINAEFSIFADWNDFLILSREIRDDDNLIVVMSRKNFLSFNSAMLKIPVYFSKYFQSNSYIFIYPTQSISMQEEKVDLTNSSLYEAIEKVDIIGKTIVNIFQKK